MVDATAYLITWTTYGTWLPGDVRGWRWRRSGAVLSPQPRLEQWCREHMSDDAVLLGLLDRAAVEDACAEHCAIRGWGLVAVNARTNHVHVVVQADAAGKVVRNQLKANCTRRLRSQAVPLRTKKTWTTGGDFRILPNDEAIEAAVAYVTDGQGAPTPASRRR